MVNGLTHRLEMPGEWAVPGPLPVGDALRWAAGRHMVDWRRRFEGILL